MERTNKRLKLSDNTPDSFSSTQYISPHDTTSEMGINGANTSPHDTTGGAVTEAKDTSAVVVSTKNG